MLDIIEFSKVFQKIFEGTEFPVTFYTENCPLDEKLVINHIRTLSLNKALNLNNKLNITLKNSINYPEIGSFNKFSKFLQLTGHENSDLYFYLLDLEKYIQFHVDRYDSELHKLSDYMNILFRKHKNTILEYYINKLPPDVILKIRNTTIKKIDNEMTPIETYLESWDLADFFKKQSKIQDILEGSPFNEVEDYFFYSDKTGLHKLDEKILFSLHMRSIP